MTTQGSTLSEVAELLRGLTFDKSQQRDSPADDYVPVLRAGNIGDVLDTRNNLIYLPRSIVSDTQLLQAGDIAICLSSGSAQIVGKTAPLEHEWRGTVGGFCGIIRPKNVESDFLAFWFCTPGFLVWRDEQARGASIQNLRFSELGALRIALPDRGRQRLIASDLREQLAEVETVREATRAQWKDAAALLAAVYRDAFQLAVPLAVPPLFGKAPADWTWRKLTDIARLESGHTPSRSRPDWWGGDVSWLSLTEIRAFDGLWVEGTQIKTNKAGIANSAARILPRGTVCFSRTASVGFVAIMAEPMATSQDFANWVCGDELDPEYLMYALIRSRAELRDLATGATHKTIYMPTLKSFHVCTPPLAEQRRIVGRIKEALEHVERIRTSLRTRQDELAALPQRLLAVAFEN